MSIELTAIKSMISAMGMKLPTDVEAANPVSKFINDQFAETFKDNEAATILKDIFTERANNYPLETLQALNRFNSALVEFGRNDDVKTYIKELNEGI